MTDFLHKLSAYTFKTCCQPYSRVGHKAILKGSNILVFGGTNFHNEVVTQILNINCESYEVSLISTRNTVPIESFSLHEFDNQIFLWGGKRTSGGNKYVSNELWKFENNLFTKLNQKGLVPSPRMMHTSVVFAKKYLVIYGGMSNTQIFNQWYVLDLEIYEWSKMTSNFQLPLNLESKIVWLDTRGIILVSQKWNVQNSKIEYCCQMYQFRIKKRQKSLHVQLQKIEVYFKNPINYRAFPTLCKYNGDFLSVAIIGGEKFVDDELNSCPQMLSDCWIVNLETYQCSKADHVQLASKYGHEAIFYKDRILLIGGICSTNQFSTFLQTIDFKLKFISIDRKLCQACKCIYGLEDFTKPKFSIKCEYETNPKSYISAKLVKKFAQVIRNPIKAFGLLIDNSLNMNANMIEINLKKVKLDSRYYKNPQQTILEMIDNSYGFSKDEILESLFTFGYKVQSCTHDSKFEEELAVRKEYGLNLKLASMRLGKSCLIMVNTIEDEKFIGYFSIDPNKCPEFKDKFNCFYYFISEKNISSEINRHIIYKNVEHLIDISDFQKSIPAPHSKILIFDFNSNSELIHTQHDKNIVLEQSDEEGVVFDNLKTYLKHLYLKPYIGRKIKIFDEEIEYQSLTQRLKREENEGKLKKIDILKYSESPSSFSVICLYHILDQTFQNKKITIYSENRLVMSLDFSNQMICGVIDLKSNIEVSIGKGSIENFLEERQLKKYLIAVIDQANSKRNHLSLKTIQEDDVNSISKAIKKRKI